MFRSDCYFAQRNPKTGVMEWFFYSREGVQGPYPTKPRATQGRETHVAYCLKRGIDGGRKLFGSSAASGTMRI
jgi:hypothetical protein